MISSRVEGIIYVPINTPADLSGSRGLIERSGIPSVCATTLVIVCVNDFMALAVVNLLTGQGIPIPGWVEVTGFDDSVFSIASPVPLTTVRQDIPAIAKATVELLNKLIASDTLTDREIIKLPTSLIVRQSTKNQK